MLIYILVIVAVLLFAGSIFFNFFRNRNLQHLQTLSILQDTITNGLSQTRQQVGEILGHYSGDLVKRFETLTTVTETKLKTISDQVEKRLATGFEKTTETFVDITRRLAIIDAAQKQIGELSGSVSSLQEILTDKRSRGTFGEVQLAALIRNVLPEKSFAFQHTLQNGKRADCILFLPAPTGAIIIDAKFPLENFRLMTNTQTNETIKKQAEQQFRQDIKKHIQDIAEKYIVPGETAEGAMMFVPAEAVFAEIHAHYPELVELAQRAQVWIVSPTTMMAVLTTARAVLRDAATRKQLHVIQQHLNLLAADFSRFDRRMQNLARHIEQAHADTSEVHVSAKRITKRFEQIEKAELEQEIM